MRYRTLGLALIGLLAAGIASAGAPQAGDSPIGEIDRAIAENWSRLVSGVDEALGVPREMRGYAAPAPGTDCDTLYLEVGRLLPLTHTRYPDPLSNPALGAAFVAGTIYAPGFYLMAAPEYARYRERPNVHQARAAVAELRARLADLNCYSR